MDMFYKSLRQHAMKIMKLKKKKMKLLPNEQQKSYENGKFCCICKEKFEDKYAKDKKNMAKLGTITFIQVNIKELHIAYVI